MSFFKILRCQLLLQISLFLQTNSTLWHQVRFGQVDINSKIQFLPNFFLRKVDFALYPYPLDKIAFNSSPPLDLYFNVLAPVVQKLDGIIHQINHYPTNKCWGNQLCFPLDSTSVIHLLNNWGQGFPFGDGRAVKKFLSSRLIMNSWWLWN